MGQIRGYAKLYADLIINFDLKLASLPFSLEFGIGSASTAVASGSTFWGSCYGFSSEFNLGYIGVTIEKMKFNALFDFSKVGFDWSEVTINLVGKAP